MSRERLADVIATYRVGLDAEVVLLEQVERVSIEQREATATRDIERLESIAEWRERLLASVMAVEAEIRPLRLALATQRAEASRAPGFSEVVELHRRAESLVLRITAADSATVAVLREAEQARRFAGRTVQRGSATLAAYRRVVASPSAAALFSQRA